MREIKFRAWNKKIRVMNSALPLKVWMDDIATDIGREKYLRNRDNIILMQYTGSGGLEKQGAVGRGLLDEYYTPVPVIEKIWQITDNYIDTTEPLNILEPSIGKGVFLSGRDFNKDTIITGYEVSPLSSKIAQTLLSDDEGCIVKIFNQPFESIFIDERGTQKQHKLTNSFDLVIGNPPYGTHRGRYKGLGEEPCLDF